jgi:hypothetical protein
MGFPEAHAYHDLRHVIVSLHGLNRLRDSCKRVTDVTKNHSNRELLESGNRHIEGIRPAKYMEAGGSTP